MSGLRAKLRRAAIAELRGWASRGPVKPRAVLYESFAGNGALCNPEALFRGLLAAPDFDDLVHIWSLDDPARHHGILREFRGNPRVRFVRRGTAAYFHALATSGYLVNNATFPPEFSKRAGQVYLNTWHGTPLKLMGYDMPDGAYESANTMKNFLAADYLLSQNSFMTEEMYESAYRLGGAFRGAVIETGYPRVDQQLVDESGYLAARSRLEAAGLPIGTRTLVLYAPTWKGASFGSPRDDAHQLLATTMRLQDLLGDDYVVLLKTHQAVHDYTSGRADFRGLLVPNDLPTNLVLAATGALVTDYSSIFFDYLASDLPIVFYTPDSGDYTEGRGTYFAPSELPGPVRDRLEDVASDLLDSTGLTATPAYREWRRRFAGLDDGGATGRVIDVVFRGTADAAPTRRFETGRPGILLYLGGMKSNGITSSALNLLGAIDHDLVDVSVIINRPMGEQQRENQSAIDPRVRQFHRIGGMNGNKLPHLRRRRAGATDHIDSDAQNRLWDDEWHRLFGDARFDSVIDFSGYSPFWATLMLHSPAAHRAIWLHNDMAAEEHREVEGRRRMARSLRQVFGLYRQFDRLVSVSGSLADVNRESLAAAESIDVSRFVAARNLVDAERVRRGAAQPLAELDDPAPAWFADLAEHGDSTWFVSVGRYSPEKNQARLLRAFATVHARHPDARLVLVGYGPLADQLSRLISELGLENAAYLTGPYSNPFPIMAAADCFVLSSDYEGQPMVLLEAAIVGLPIVSVAFKSVGDALDTGRLHIVEQDDAALTDGMLAALEGRVLAAHLDVDAYTAEAIGEFMAVVTPEAALNRKEPLA